LLILILNINDSESKMKKLNFVLLFFLLAFSHLTADNARFTASVSKNPVSAGEQFQLTFSLENAGGTNFKPPSFKGFSILMGPSQSQSMSVVNGQMSQSISYSYVLQAGNEGNYTIGPATVEVNGNTLKTNSITMNVVKGAVQPKNQNKDEKTLDAQANDVIKKNLYLKLNISKSDAYQGDQIIATYTLYVHPELQLLQLNPSKEPSFNGFWTQNIDIGKVQFRTETVNGVPFKVAVIKKVVLIPQQTGKLVADPYVFECAVRLAVQGQRQRRSFFDDFFNNNSYKDFKYDATSGSANINVKALPGSTPVDFKGGVGNLSFRAWLDKTETKTNEPVTLKVQVSGSGNLKLIEPFGLNLPPDIETFDPKVNDNINVTPSGISGNRVFEYILIPRHSGEFKIDPIKFTYFNPSSKQYVNLSSGPFTLKVEQGTGSESSQIISGVNKEDVKFIGKDIRYLKSSTANLSRNGHRFFASGSFWLMSALPLMFFIFFFIYQKRKEKMQGDRALLKLKRATKVARKRLAEANKFLKQSKQDKFYEELSKALWGYLSDKLGIDFADLTKDSASNTLAGMNVPEDKITKYMETIDYCEFARFAPAEQTFEMQKVYEDAVSIISDLEGNLR